MSQVIKVKNNLANESPYSFLSSSISTGGTALPVKNINAFQASWGVHLGKTGEETSEILMMGTATPSGTVLNTTGTVKFAHSTDTPVYAIKYDQMVFKVSTSGTSGTVTPITDGTLTITPDSTITQFDYASGSVTYAYKVSFRNSVSGEQSSNSDFITSLGFSFYSLAKIRERAKSKLFSANYMKEDAVVNDWVNEWLEKMTNTAIDVNKDYNIGTVDVSFGTNGLGTITSDNFKEARRIWITYNGSDYYEATKIDPTGYVPSQSFNSTHPYFEYAGDNIVKIHPSDSAGTVRLTYYTLQTALTNDTDTLPVSMRGYSKSFVDYTLSMAYYLDDKDAKGKLFMDSANIELERFRVEITPRSKTGPQFIQMLDAISGDEESHYL